MRQLRSLVLPFAVLVLIPGLLLRGGQSGTLLGSHRVWPVAQVAGAAVVGALGLVLMVVTIRLFATVGKGTLAPWDATKRLVVHGPYRHVRNPMISGVLCLLVAETLAVGSLLLAGFTAFFWVVNTVYFMLVEEPGLERRFGDEYREYKRNVPRWLPRRSPWLPGARR